MLKYYILLLFLAGTQLYAQEYSAQLLGTVLSNKKRLANVHIINLNSKRGSVSNKNGEFLLSAKVNDTLYVSSIQYEKVNITVTERMIRTKELYILTQSKTYELDEVIVKNHDLTQSLYHDILHKPKGLGLMGENSFDFKNLNFSAISFNADQMSSLHPPSVEHLVNPIAGGGATAGIPNFQLIAEHKLRKRLKKKKEVPLQLIAELRNDFFIENLKIPADEIHLFVSYCEPRNIIKLYSESKLLKVIKILQQEAPIYLALKKEN